MRFGLKASKRVRVERSQCDYHWLSERSERSHSQFMTIEICHICQYSTCIAGSKVIAFDVSAKFEMIALKTAGK